MIVASISLLKPKVTLVSIPRDVWIPEIRAKVNSAYYWGNQKEDNGGLSLAKSTVQPIIGDPIQYGLVIDFSGFKKVIDVLGGVSVNVQNSFVDNKYPIAGKENDLCNGDKEYKCRYETIKFESGVVKMDGETALKFVRSRNAEGDEGTDLAREARQQLVINGIKEKVLSFEVLTSPTKISALIDAIKSSIETDMDVTAASAIAKTILKEKPEIKSYLVPEELLFHPPVSTKYDNQYVFIPKSGNWLEVQNWFKSLVN
jgi:LCP family protein required for cell wall assembly